eukprot:jgi/Botrbrau1/13128/Bobra.0187s0083.1
MGGGHKGGGGGGGGGGKGTGADKGGGAGGAAATTATGAAGEETSHRKPGASGKGLPANAKPFVPSSSALGSGKGNAGLRNNAQPFVPKKPSGSSSNPQQPLKKGFSSTSANAAPFVPGTSGATSASTSPAVSGTMSSSAMPFVPRSQTPSGSQVGSHGGSHGGGHAGRAGKFRASPIAASRQSHGASDKSSGMSEAASQERSMARILVGGPPANMQPGAGGQARPYYGMPQPYTLQLPHQHHHGPQAMSAAFGLPDAKSRHHEAAQSHNMAQTWMSGFMQQPALPGVRDSGLRWHQRGRLRGFR